jgi:hypothetical protein
MYVRCELANNRTKLCPAIKTSYRPQHAKKEWKEWIIFPVKYKDINQDTVLCVTIIDVIAPRKKIIVGGATYALFENTFLIMGDHKIKIWPKQAADGQRGGTTMGDMKTQDDMLRMERVLQEVCKLVLLTINRKQLPILDSNG